MANNLEHSPSEIVQKLLVAKSHGSIPTNPPGDNTTWPIGIASERQTPDNTITTYDTQGIDHGRFMHNGELQGHYGIQIRVRSTDHQTGWLKADAVQKTIAEDVDHYTVAIGAKRYLVTGFYRIGDVLTIGKDTSSKRSLFTLNAVVGIRQLA